MSVEYKYKPDKHKFRVNLKTIDEIHKEQLDEFKKQREAIPEKQKLLESTQNELRSLEQAIDSKYIELDFETIKARNSLRSTIRTLKDEIDRADNYNTELEYYSRTGDVLRDYYEITNGVLYGKQYETTTNQDLDAENKSKIVISDELLEITNLNRKRKLKRPVRKRNKKVEMAPTKSVMSILLGEDETEIQDEQSANCKASLQNQYLLIMDKEYACSKSKVPITKKCKICNLDKMIIYNESIISCPKCGDSEEILIESDMPSQRETFTEKPKYPYKKLGHCIEKLNQFLCKGTINIPPYVFSILENEIEKSNKNRSSVTTSFLKSMMKKHKLSDYYENIMYIHSKITGKKPHNISREEYELALKMFVEAEELYEKKYKPTERNNFLKYSLVLNFIFEYIGREDIAEHFTLLKSEDKLKLQKGILCKMSDELGWDKYKDQYKKSKNHN